MTFLGASPIRAYAEEWSSERLRQLTANAVALGVRGDLPVAFVTEDTVRAHPQVLEELFRTAIGEGAQRLILCDTVGHATPKGVTRLVTWTRELLDKLGRDDVLLDFHGHNDRGLALVNSLAAYHAGCARLHGTALGIGERVGNTSIDQLLVNLSLMGAVDHGLADLMAYCTLASQATGRIIPQNYPVVGADAFAHRAKWKEAEALMARVAWLVVGREGEPDPDGVTVPTRFPDVSSTEVRRRVRAGLPIDTLVPAGVAALVAAHEIYR